MIALTSRRGTSARTATHAGSASGAIVGDSSPGVTAVAAKIFGMGALFLLVGQKLLATFAPSRRPVALALGFAVLGGISLLPIAGAIVWSAASIAAVGIAFLSRFGAPRFRLALPA